MPHDPHYVIRFQIHVDFIDPSRYNYLLLILDLLYLFLLLIHKSAHLHIFASLAELLVRAASVRLKTPRAACSTQAIEPTRTAYVPKIISRRENVLAQM